VLYTIIRTLYDESYLDNGSKYIYAVFQMQNNDISFLIINIVIQSIGTRQGLWADLGDHIMITNKINYQFSKLPCA
jgi:hypothetical protein